MIMNVEEFLRLAFEAPDNIVTLDEFLNWEAEQIMKEIEENSELRDLELSEEDRKRIYQNVMHIVKKS